MHILRNIVSEDDSELIQNLLLINHKRREVADECIHWGRVTHDQFQEMTWVSLVISTKDWLSITFSALFKRRPQDTAQFLALNGGLTSISEMTNGCWDEPSQKPSAAPRRWRPLCFAESEPTDQRSSLMFWRQKGSQIGAQVCLFSFHSLPWLALDGSSLPPPLRVLLTQEHFHLGRCPASKQPSHSGGTASSHRETFWWEVGLRLLVHLSGP